MSSIAKSSTREIFCDFNRFLDFRLTKEAHREKNNLWTFSFTLKCFIFHLKALKVFTSLKPREHLWFLHAWLFKRLLQLELIPLGQYLRNRYLLHLPNLLQFLLVFCLQVRCQLLFARKLSVSALRRIIRRKMVNIQQKMLVACAVRRLALWVCRSCDCCFFGSLEEMVFYLRL